MSFVGLFALLALALGSSGLVWRLIHEHRILARAADRARRHTRAWSVALGHWREWAIYNRAHVKENAKCPGCGHRRGAIQADPVRRVMVHTCHVCRAEWGEPFVLQPEIWLGARPDTVSAAAIRSFE